VQRLCIVAYRDRVRESERVTERERERQRDREREKTIKSRGGYTTMIRD
jgi:hypothetical protein